MINIEKLKEKGALAKEMVQKGMAEDIEDALSKIESENLVRSVDDFKVGKEKPKDIEISEAEQNPKEDKPSFQAVVTDPEVIERIKKLETSLNDLTEFILEFQKKTNDNLVELDNKIDKVKGLVCSCKSDSAPVPSVEKAVESSKKTEEVCKEEPKEYDVSIENIFSNANNKMQKRPVKKF